MNDPLQTLFKWMDSFLHGTWQHLLLFFFRKFVARKSIFEAVSLPNKLKLNYHVEFLDPFLGTKAKKYFDPKGQLEATWILKVLLQYKFENHKSHDWVYCYLS